MPALPPALALPGRILSSLVTRSDLHATTTGILPPSRVVARQGGTTTVVVAPADTQEGNRTSTLSGGAIAGIVIGSIIGILLLIWIIHSCSNLGAPKAQQRDPAWYDDVEADRRRSRSRPRQHRHHDYDHDRRHHHHHSSRSRSRRPSAEMRTVTPVVVQERGARSPRRPSATYVYEDPRRVSRSRSRGY